MKGIQNEQKKKSYEIFLSDKRLDTGGESYANEPESYHGAAQ